jgi:hypothetical protein
MKAAIVHSLGDTPKSEEFPDPPPTGSTVRLLAASDHLSSRHLATTPQFNPPTEGRRQ